MATIFLVHGAYGNPEENWFPWLKKELEKLGHKVIAPEFPTPENQTFSSWLNVFEKYSDELNKDSIVVCHSLGVPFFLTLLEQRSVKAAFFVSGFFKFLGNPIFDTINATFLKKRFNWKKIKIHCRQFFIFHGSNDPYVPLEQAHELAKHLNTKPIIVEDAGHFNIDAGYAAFPLLLERVRKAIKVKRKIKT